MDSTTNLETEISQNIKQQRIPDLYSDHCGALMTEITRLRAVNAAQSDMLKGAAAAAAQREQERVALHKLIASVLVDLDSQSPMWCKVLLRAMRREYAEIVAEANHA